MERPETDDDQTIAKSCWRAFARGYNGPGYARHRYHEKLSAAFQRFTAEPVTEDEGVAGIQEALNRADLNLTVDGIWGSRTEAALREFQRRAGLAVDGIAGPNTRAALGLAPA